GTKPGSVRNSQLPVRTWAQWDDAVPGFVEIDTVFHDGGNRGGGHAFTLTVTDIATGWTETRSLPDRAAKTVLAALNHIAAAMPFPIVGVDSDNGSEFINDDLFAWCQDRKITFTRSRPGNKNDGCHVEQKNWSVVRAVVGYYRYDAASELLLLNEIWHLQSKLTNYFQPQQKLISKVRTGAKVSRKHDKATTPFHRAVDHPSMTVDRIVALKRTYSLINPAATGRQIQALTAQLFTLATSKAQAGVPAPVTKRARSREATNHPSRAS
ncbi:integrase catalytic domain-containing protein, partial [Mycolicibacterium fortuitum]|uniref:integrase catalytic domain-containing protein n=1 Tax=Mycolicibacterium fortuitum TaxID=1766 RepID=UPI0007EF3A43